MLLLVLIPLEQNKRYSIFPGNDDFYIYGFADSENLGHSQSLKFHLGDDEIIYRYVLKKGVEYPFCGVGFEYAKRSEFLSIIDFDKIIIEIKSSNATKLRSAMRFYVPDITRTDVVTSYRYLLKEIDVSPQYKRIIIKLDQYQTPNWWFINNNTSEQEIGPVDFRKFVYFELINTELFPINLENEISIKKIILEKDYLAIYILLAGFILLYYIIYGILFFHTNKAPPADWHTPYRHLNLENYEDMCAKKVFDYILTHCFDCDISVKGVSKATGIPAYKIPEYINNIFTLSFKQYINRLRIEEAKHLLERTDRRITEIAFSVGYNNSTHFNRIFKEFSGETPKSYRLNHVSKKC